MRGMHDRKQTKTLGGNRKKEIQLGQRETHSEGERQTFTPFFECGLREGTFPLYAMSEARC